MTPQEAATRAAAALDEAETQAERGRCDQAHALRAVSDGWTQLGVALAQNPTMIVAVSTS